MIGKGELIELVTLRVDGATSTERKKKFDPRYIAYVVGTEYKKVLEGYVLRMDWDSLDAYTKTYTGVSVAQDATTDVYYSTLPENVVALPTPGSGVRRVSTTDGASVEFVPMTNNELQTIEGLEVDTVDDVIGYVFKNGRVEYYGMTSAITQVRMDLLIPFEAYDDDDTLQIPSGVEYDIIEASVAKLILTPNYDQLNDNNTVNTT